MSLIITGKNTVIEAIKAGRKIYEIYILEKSNDEIIDFAKENNIKYKELNKKAIKELLPSNNQGVGALVDDYEYKDLDKVIKKEGNKLVVILDSLEDPHNLGAILRSADAFDVDAVIIPKNRSVQLNQTVAKVSTGAIEYVNVVQVTNLTQTIKKLKKEGFWVVGTDAEGTQTIHDIDPNMNIALVIGNEGKGIGRLVKDNCDFVVKIPMTGHVNSLNASVSAALVIYDIYNRRG